MKSTIADRFGKLLLLSRHISPYENQGLAASFRKRARHFWRILAVRLCAKSFFLTDFLFCFWPVFREEHRAVLFKKISELESGGMSDWTQTLRVRIHCLEKGMAVPERYRRDVFAEDYIESAVDLFRRLIALPPDQYEGLRRWAGDVLAEFFAVARPSSRIERARARFFALQLAPELKTEARRIPQPYLTEEPPVGYRALRALSLRRRSVRWFRQQPVPREMVDRAMEIALFSPSACNMQPFRFVIVDERSEIARVSKLAVGLTCFSPIPLLVVVIGDLSQLPTAVERHSIYIDASLAVMSLLYGLEVQGLASCCLLFHESRHMMEHAAEVLHLSITERLVMLVAVGYADPSGLVAFSQKKSLAEARTYGIQCRPRR